MSDEDLSKSESEEEEVAPKKGKARKKKSDSSDDDWGDCYEEAQQEIRAHRQKYPGARHLWINETRIMEDAFTRKMEKGERKTNKQKFALTSTKGKDVKKGKVTKKGKTQDVKKKAKAGKKVKT